MFIHNNLLYSTYFFISDFIIFERCSFGNDKPVVKVMEIIEGILICHIAFLLRTLINSAFTDNILSKEAIIIEYSGIVV